MTDRVNHLTVVLDHSYREDDVEAIAQAILLIKGVVSVGKNVTQPADYMAKEQAKYELRGKLFKALDDE